MNKNIWRNVLTNKAARKYNLQDYKVYFEDDPNNPKFINVTNLPKYLTYGKHYALISYDDFPEGEMRLKENSQVQFEFED